MWNNESMIKNNSTSVDKYTRAHSTGFYNCKAINNLLKHKYNCLETFTKRYFTTRTRPLVKFTHTNKSKVN